MRDSRFATVILAGVAIAFAVSSVSGLDSRGLEAVSSSIKETEKDTDASFVLQAQKNSAWWEGDIAYDALHPDVTVLNSFKGIKKPTKVPNLSGYFGDNGARQGRAALVRSRGSRVQAETMNLKVAEGYTGEGMGKIQGGGGEGKHLLRGELPPV